MDSLISLGKVIGFTAVLMAPLFWILLGYIKFEEDCKKWDLEHRKMFGGDLWDDKDRILMHHCSVCNLRFYPKDRNDTKQGYFCDDHLINKHT